MRLRNVIALICGASLLLSGAAFGQSGQGQIHFENRSSIALDFYVDDTYACRALANFNCTTHAYPGAHTVAAKVGGTTTASGSVEVAAGGIVTWTVSEEPQSQTQSGSSVRRRW